MVEDSLNLMNLKKFMNKHCFIALMLLVFFTTNSISADYTEEESINQIMSSEEIKRWKSDVGHKGNEVIIRLEQSPSKASSLWCFRLLEDFHTHTVTFGVYCIDTYTKNLSRMDMATEQLVPIGIIMPLSTKKLLSIIPEKMFGWMLWQDNIGSPIDMIIYWTKRSTIENKAIFYGKVTYIQLANKRSESYMQMSINVDTRKVIITETESKKQKNFDVQGKFYGELQADLLTIVGQWRKPNYDRVADFSIFDRYNDE